MFKENLTIKKLVLGLMAFVFAIFLPGLFTVVSLYGIFHFSKKKPDKTLRNIFIGLALTGFFISAVTNSEETNISTASVEKQEQKTEKTETVKPKEDSKDKKQEELESKELEMKEKEEAEKAEAESKKEEEEKQKVQEELKEKQKEAEKAKEEAEKELQNVMEKALVDDFIVDFNESVASLSLEKSDLDPKFFNVKVYDEEFAAEIAMAIVDSEYRYGFNDMLGSLADVSVKFKNTVAPGYTFMFVNPMNEENIIAIIIDGEIVYNAMDEYPL